MHRGYIKVWRKSVDSRLYFAEPFTKWHAWQDLIMIANHTCRTIDVRGVMVEVKRGEVLASEEFLATRWKWSRGKVRRFLRFLVQQTVQQIVQRKSNVCSIITIVNYNLYHPNGTADGTADSTADGTAAVQQTDTPKDLKELIKINNIYITEFFDYFTLKTKKNFKLTDDKKALITKRLKEGYTLDDLKKATDNFVADTWEGRSTHLDLLYCIGKQKGKPDNLEKWINANDRIREKFL